MPKFPAKMEQRVRQKWCHQNLDDDGFDFAILKIPITTVSIKSNGFDKLAQKTALL